MRMPLKILLVLFKFLFANGQQLTGLTRYTGTVCVDSEMVLASCPDTAVIAVEDIRAGANLLSRNCPESYKDLNNTECCSEKPDDCIFRLSDIGFGHWHDDCSGRTQCKTAGAQADVTNSTKCKREDFEEIYGNFTQYIAMYYYCIDLSRIHSISTGLSTITSTDLLFIQSDSYPSGQTAASNYKCSVEVDDCEAKIEIFTIHIDYKKTNNVCDRQRLRITDGDVDREYNCSSNTIRRISNITTDTSYITVEMYNGKFWLGFRASSSTALLMINCPATLQTHCTRCPNLPSILNGTVSHDRGLSVGRKAMYSCDSGYRIIGNVTRTCLETGIWSGSEPTCEIIEHKECSPLLDIDNGMVSTMGELGQNATYSCNEGFFLIGPSTRTCMENGVWHGSEPSCSKPDCPKLYLEHGTITIDGGNIIGGNATYTCNTGYQIVGDITRTCQESGRWSGDEPMCENAIALPGLESFRSPVCVDDVSFLASCKGHPNTVIAIESIMAGANLLHRKCPASYKDIDIKSTDCCRIKSDDCRFRVGTLAYENWHDKCTGLQECQTPGAQQDVTNKDKCGSHFMEDYGLLTQYMYMNYYCIDSSKMHSISTPLTEEIYSDNMEFLVSDSYPSSSADKSSYRCSVEIDHCYAKINVYTIHLDLRKTNGQCDNQSLRITDGVTIKEFTCINNSFEGISVYETATTYITVEFFNFEATVDYKFWLGFGASREIAPLRINCPTGEQVRCMKCDALSSPEKGSLVFFRGIGSHLWAQFSCDTGYFLVGNNLRECQDNGSWSNEQPFCQIKDCCTFDAPVNGRVTFPNGTTYMSVAIISCDERHTLFGARTRKCEADALWSISDSKCRFRTCSVQLSDWNRPQTSCVWNTSVSDVVYSQCLFRGQLLPTEDLETTVVCRGEIFEGRCPVGKKMVILDVLYRTKLNSSCTSGRCCDHDDAKDCMLPYTETDIHSACTGRQFCDVQPIPSTSTESCGDTYSAINHNTVIQYYCVDRTKILSLCSVGSLNGIGRLFHINNHGYPDSIASSDTNCSCSVETTDCDSKINVYFIHFKISEGDGLCIGSQKIYVHEYGKQQVLSCNDNTNYTITLRMTSESNYLTVTLDNKEEINGGMLWLGFEATETASPLQINCPALPQTRCIECPLLTSPKNGGMFSIDEVQRVGNVVSYRCFTGYILRGEKFRRCYSNYTWSGTDPICVARELGDNCSLASDCSEVINGSTCKDGLCTCVSGYREENNVCINTAAAEEQGSGENEFDSAVNIAVLSGSGAVALIAISTAVICYKYRLAVKTKLKKGASERSSHDSGPTRTLPKPPNPPNRTGHPTGYIQAALRINSQSKNNTELRNNNLSDYHSISEDNFVHDARLENKNKPRHGHMPEPDYPTIDGEGYLQFERSENVIIQESNENEAPLDELNYNNLNRQLRSQSYEMPVQLHNIWPH